ncbi:hypothetical protein T484DRAFT_1797853 [Baffinella frigidus]|nr:hypothetical protein T484DRAFT_1797853 [Cryptophyta sp. CCMP2293]
MTYDPPRERFADGGKMSRFMDSLKIGDKITIQGPFGHIEYKGRGNFENMRKPMPLVKHVGMVAGGTGITPMLQHVGMVAGGAGINPMLQVLTSPRNPKL